MLARTLAGLAAARATTPSPVVLVPTMGALHEGHRALLRRARVAAGSGGSVVASVFVNPLQFGAGEDLERYPRSLDRDVRICAAEGADVVFAPRSDQMYPGRQQVTVDPGPVGRVLEGACRPALFGGALTVVLKLFHLVGPDAAVFGEKDAQQLFLVRAMTADLNIPVEIIGVPTVREADGLAASSRNAYLTPGQRERARALPRALRAGADAAEAGGDADAVLAAARAELGPLAGADPPLRLDYLALADPATFGDLPERYRGPALLLVAARVGDTRLIDNVTVRIGSQT